MKMKIKTFISLICLLVVFSACAAQNMIPVSSRSFERKDSKGNRQVVNIKPFFIDKYMITVSEWNDYLAATKKNNAEWKRSLIYSLDDWKLKNADSDWPAWNISWIEAVEYCNWLSKKQGYTECYRINIENNTVQWDVKANGFRLPTVAEWQSISGLYEKNVNKEELFKNNWFAENNNQEFPHKVGELGENKYGICDAFGNMRSFCWDFYDPDQEYSSAVYDPTGSQKFIPDPDEVYFNEEIHETRYVAGGDFGTYFEYAIRNPLSYVVNISKGFVGIRIVRNK